MTLKYIKLEKNEELEKAIYAADLNDGKVHWDEEIALIRREFKDDLGLPIFDYVVKQSYKFKSKRKPTDFEPRIFDNYGEALANYNERLKTI